MDVPAERRAYQASVFGYIAETILPLLKRDGLWLSPDPLPLNSKEAQEVLESVIKHDNYRCQALGLATEDGYTVWCEDGRIRKERN